MSDKTASEWIAAAYAQTLPLDDDLFQLRVDRARNEARYHGDIVPAMMREDGQNGPKPYYQIVLKERAERNQQQIARQGDAR